MKLSDFKIGEEFWDGDRQWRCTDIGSRVVVAMRVDRVEIGSSAPQRPRTLSRTEAEAEGWFNGPPYSVAERVFDEDDQEGCTVRRKD
jgi:hypothetical protein